MNSQCVNEKTVHILEILVILILVFQLLTACFASDDAHPLALTFIDLVTVALFLVGFAWSRAQQVAWTGLMISGLASILLDPLDVSSVLLTLVALFIQYSNGLFAHKTRMKTTLGVLLIVAVQIGSVFLARGKFWEILVHSAVTDALIAAIILLNPRAFAEDPKASQTHLSLPALMLGDCNLTPREIQIIHLIWGGQSTKEIACELGLTDGAVRMVLSRTYPKLKVMDLRGLSNLIHSHQIVWDRT